MKLIESYRPFLEIVGILCTNKVEKNNSNSQHNSHSVHIATQLTQLSEDLAKNLSVTTSQAAQIAFCRGKMWKGQVGQVGNEGPMDCKV